MNASANGTARLRDELFEIITATMDQAASGGTRWWRSPLLAACPADARFERLTQLVQPTHFRPQDLLPTARSVLVYFLPFLRELVAENRRGEWACLNWALAYRETNQLIARINENMSNYLAKLGFLTAVTPATHNYDPVRLLSRWSHKHVAYLANLGRFGHHAQLITPQGSAGRLGSLVTEADLGENRILDDGQELCLHKLGRKCLVCVKNCPIKALTAEGFDRFSCQERLKATLAAGPESAKADVCGKCVALTPCSLASPVKD